MKRKLLVCAITLVIAGLMITSATGLQVTQMTTELNEKKVETFKEESIVKRLTGKELSELQQIDAEMVQHVKKSNTEKVQMKSQRVMVEETTNVAMEKMELDHEIFVKPTQKFRQPYLSIATHPGVSDADNGHLLMVYEDYFDNYSVDPGVPEFDSLLFVGSSNHGDDDFGQGVYFKNITSGEPIDDTYPTIDFKMMNGSRSVFVFTSQPPSGPNSGDFSYMYLETDDPYNLNDSLVHEGWTVGFSSSGYANIQKPELSCHRGLPRYHWGMAAAIVDRGANSACPGFFLTDTDNGSCWVSTFALPGASSADVMIDEEGLYAPLAWQVPYTGYGECIIVTVQNISDISEHNSGWIHYFYSPAHDMLTPSVAINNGGLILGLEAFNATSGEGTFELVFNDDAIDYYDNANLYYGDLWTTTDPNVRLWRSELEHVEGDVFICTAILDENIYDPTSNCSMVFAITYDAGLSWSNFYYWNGDEKVIDEYKAIDLSDGASISIWEYDAYDFWGGDLLTGSVALFYSFETLKLKGRCTYVPPPPDVPVDPVDVVVDVNKTGAYPLAGLDEGNGYYSRHLVLGWDIWSNMTERLIARDPNSHSCNVTDMWTGTINLGIPGWWEITQDLVLDIYYKDLVDFPFYYAENITRDWNQMCGPAVLQMILNYMHWNSTSDPDGPPELFDNQTVLYDEAIVNNSDPALGYLDTRGIWHTLQNNLPGDYSEYGYNFAMYHDADPNVMLATIATWIDYEVLIHKPGYPESVPVAIPAYGDYTNWMAVRGVHTNKAAYPLPGDLVVKGFWVNDPLWVGFGGIGENTYKTASEFTDICYKPLTGIDSGAEFYNEYVAVCEPPIDAEPIDAEAIDIIIDEEPKFEKKLQTATAFGVSPISPVHQLIWIKAAEQKATAEIEEICAYSGQSLDLTHIGTYFVRGTQPYVLVCYNDAVAVVYKNGVVPEFAIGDGQAFADSIAGQRLVYNGGSLYDVLG
jgi:hypothetical protein